MEKSLGKTCQNDRIEDNFQMFLHQLHYIYQKRMNQENMWVMFYIMPQFINFEPELLNYQTASSTKMVEYGIDNKNMELIKSSKAAAEENMGKKTNYSYKIQQKLVEDSSFQIPVKQENKTAQQKLGRNSVSNILRLFTKLLKTIILKEKYQKVKDKYNFDVSLKEFNSWINCIGLNTSKYIRIKKVLNGIRSKPHLGQIVGIFYSIFEADFARQAVLTSSKTQAKNIMPTLAQIRNIRQEINKAIKLSLARPNRNKQNVFN